MAKYITNNVDFFSPFYIPSIILLSTGMCTVELAYQQRLKILKNALPVEKIFRHGSCMPSMSIFKCIHYLYLFSIIITIPFRSLIVRNKAFRAQQNRQTLLQVIALSLSFFSDSLQICFLI